LASITIEIEKDEVRQLVMEAEPRSVTVEELVRAGALALLQEPSDGFEAAMEHVLRKHQELYRRLA